MRGTVKNQQPGKLHIAPKHSLVLGVHKLIASNARLLSLYGGSAIVLLWTVLRHINNGVNYDVVGQVGLARQWAAGDMGGVQLGATNYLIKMPAYFLVNALHFLTPMNRLLVLAAMFNIAAFWLLFILYGKIMGLYNLKNQVWMYLSLAWLATIFGNVVWADYANSRNLELAGGMLLIYLTLKFLKHKNVRCLIWLGALSSVVFFSDPLQLYVCGGGICAFLLGRSLAVRTKASLCDTARLCGSLLVGYGGSLALGYIAKHALHVTFLAAPNNTPALTTANLASALHGVAVSTLQVFGANFVTGPYGVTTVREALNFLVVVTLACLVIKQRQKVTRITLGLALVLIAVNYLAYIAGGEALAQATSRYLIMIPLLMLLLICVNGEQINKQRRVALQYAWLAAIVINSTLLVGALAISWPHRHTNDRHINTVIAYIKHANYRYALSSREIGITTTYFAQGKATVLPMACTPDHRLAATNLFYDKAAFSRLLSYKGTVPIIVPPGGIKYLTNCTADDVRRQFGLPNREQDIPGVGVALLYDMQRLRAAHIEASLNW